MPSKPRNYKDEYKKFQSSPKDLKNRAARNKARAEGMKKGIVKKGDGKDLHHVNGINNKKVVAISASKNRGMPEASRLPGSKRKKTK